MRAALLCLLLMHSVVVQSQDRQLSAFKQQLEQDYQEQLCPVFCKFTSEAKFLEHVQQHIEHPKVSRRRSVPLLRKISKLGSKSTSSISTTSTASPIYDAVNECWKTLETTGISPREISP